MGRSSRFATGTAGPPASGGTSRSPADSGTGSELPDDYVELTELHVSPSHQGRGIGSALLRNFLAERTEGTVMLSTPEVENESNGAWRLYRSLGFGDVLRSHRFDGDARPFAVLSRSLPLPEQES